MPLFVKSDPGGILTPDFQNRNLTFYTAELRGRIFCFSKNRRPADDFRYFSLFLASSLVLTSST